MTAFSTHSATPQRPPDSCCRILIVYDTNSGKTYRMAQLIGRGVESVPGCQAVLRSVPKVGDRTSTRLPEIPESGAPHASTAELPECDGFIMGSPTHFGNMSGSLKHFLDQSTEQWFAAALSGKPAAVFTSTGSMHGGQESTLLSMMIPLLHHGMLICGLPYSNPELMQTTTGGTPYGASHVAGEDGNAIIDDNESTLCRALGSRVASIAKALLTSTTGT
ncbi:NAD(P)H:quinone oxidoreductase [Granulosicoccus sp.]|nr:NAD(P)H:quinone oxidoreductase [Granulosicoccus sp.]MDB4222603.1 NAD(P)H:quinone oxidoreductase [Granulosicoccus sp.]